jgi:chromosomal replication initiator protein
MRGMWIAGGQSPNGSAGDDAGGLSENAGGLSGNSAPVDAAQLWMRVLLPLHARLSEQTFATWLGPLRLDRIEPPHAFVRAPSRFHADWVSAHYGAELEKRLREELGQISQGEMLRVEWEIDPELAEVSMERDPQELDAATTSRDGLRAPLASLASMSPNRARLDLPSASAPLDLFGTTLVGVPSPAGRTPSSPPPRKPSSRTPTRGVPLPKDRRNYELPFGAAASPSGDSTETPLPDASEYALNPRYTFDNFIVGPSNQLAHAAGVAASASPGKRYNPLFIYSKVGLGKTHLVNAVGHAVHAERPSSRVYFLSAERFTNEFIWALQHRRIDEFRARYRQHCDVLVIDDIQFLAGREQTQEEFFHTFNALYHADKQIVVTSDRYPQEIGEMQDRLVSRFQWGMVADIQAPELDTRIAILQKKAEQERIPLASDVALYVAQRVESNVRELEGTLLRLAMRADLLGRAIDLELSRSMLGAPNTVSRSERATTVEDIQRATAEYFGLTVRELCGDRRHRGVSQPRMIAMWIARERLKMSYPDIGRRFGGKDHTTVMSGYKKIAFLLEQGEEAITRAADAIERKLGLK